MECCGPSPMAGGTPFAIFPGMNPPRNNREETSRDDHREQRDATSPEVESNRRAAESSDNDIGIPSGYLERTFASKRSPVPRRKWSEGEKEN